MSSCSVIAWQEDHLVTADGDEYHLLTIPWQELKMLLQLMARIVRLLQKCKHLNFTEDIDHQSSNSIFLVLK